MRFGGPLSLRFLPFLVQSVFAGPGGFLSLVNGTPYTWKLTYSHSYYMDWQPAAYVTPGTSYLQYVEYWYHHGANGDCQGEATYTLLNDKNETLRLSFTVHAKQKNGKSLQIKYHDQLASLGNPKNSILNLGFQQDGAVNFVLAGNSPEDFISSNPPLAWMQATLPSIRGKSLRELAMPYTHDAGMSEVTRYYGGVAHNTVTQSHNIYDQLRFGARWLDIRPMHRKGKWFTQHMSGPFLLGLMFGCTGRTIENIVKDINKFTAENPGELIVLDISHEIDDSRTWITHLSVDLWQKLYIELSKINDLWCTPCTHLPDDLSTLPLSTFIQPGSRSAVLIRIPDWAPALPDKNSKRDQIGDSNQTRKSDKTSKSHKTIPIQMWKRDDEIAPEMAAMAVPADGDENSYPAGPAIELWDTQPSTATVRTFIPYTRLPVTGSFSDTNKPSYLTSDQLMKFSEARTSPKSSMHRSTWTITQKWARIADVGNPGTSLLKDARAAHIAMYRDLWNALSKSNYPNLIEIDDIHDSGITVLCMAINRYFAISLG